jgi:hypothetical protein
MTAISAIKRHRLLLIVGLAGLLFSLYLQGEVIDGVYFSGDAGLKALLTKQFCAGQFHLDLRVPADPWVQELWDRGFYPFGPTFVYETEGRYYTVFPAVFSVISAPCFGLFGYRGLYIIPLVSIWVLWLAFAAVSRSLGLGELGASAALAVLVFASPLTLYSAMYWEHTLAVCLAFGGVVLVVLTRHRPSARSYALLGGMLTGLSVWFRAEHISLVGVICLALFISPRLRERYRHKTALVGGMVLAIALFMAVNMAIFGHPLGIRALWVPDRLRLYGRLERSLRILKSMSSELLAYFPMALFPAAGLALSMLNRRVKLAPYVRILFWGALLFALVAAVMLPNTGGKQWGPRYLLVLVPVISLLTGAVLEALLGGTGAATRYVIVVVFLCLFGFGVYKNSWSGTLSLRDDYRGRVLPALNLVTEHQSRIVVVAHQWISQEMETALDRKIFFRAVGAQEVRALATELLDRGYDGFLYLTLDYQDKPDDQSFTVDDRALEVEFSALGQYGSYLVYEAEIAVQDDGGARNGVAGHSGWVAGATGLLRERTCVLLSCIDESAGWGYYA